MRITYDQQAEALYIRFNNQRSTGAHVVNDHINIRTSEDDTIVGIEVLSLSQLTDDIDSIIEQYDIRKVRETERLQSQSGS